MSSFPLNVLQASLNTVVTEYFAKTTNFIAFPNCQRFFRAIVQLLNCLIQILFDYNHIKAGSFSVNNIITTLFIITLVVTYSRIYYVDKVLALTQMHPSCVVLVGTSRSA